MGFSSTTKSDFRKRLGQVVVVARRRSSLLEFGVISLLIGSAIFGLLGMQQVADSDGFSDDQLESDLQLLGAVGVRDSGSRTTGTLTVESDDTLETHEPRRFEAQDGIGRPLIVGRFEEPEAEHQQTAIDSAAPLFGDTLAMPKDRSVGSSAGTIQPTQFETSAGLAQANGPVATAPATGVPARPGQAAWLTGKISID